MATIQDGTDSQVVKRYEPGELFGEKALIDQAKRAATVSAVGKVSVWTLSRSAFELRLKKGMQALAAEQYLTDPRRLISEFYRRGQP